MCFYALLILHSTKLEQKLSIVLGVHLYGVRALLLIIIVIVLVLSFVLNREVKLPFKLSNVSNRNIEKLMDESRLSLEKRLVVFVFNVWHKQYSVIGDYQVASLVLEKPD